MPITDPDRNPNLREKMDMVNEWFGQAAKGRQYDHVDLTIGEIAEMLVKKQLVSDKDTGVKHIMKSLNIRDKEIKLNYTIFQRVFCRSIFKESLTEVLREIEET